MLKLTKLNMVLADHAGPGHWNDPDMLEVGNGGMAVTEYQTHFALWAIMAAPLLIGCDLRRISPENLAILLNTDVIAIDQDPLGVQGRPVRSEDGHHVFVKPLDGGDVAVALFNETDAEAEIVAVPGELGLESPGAGAAKDLWTGDRIEVGTAGLGASVPAHGTAIFRVSAG